MIDTTKLLQRSSEKSSTPSVKMAMNIRVIKKDFKRIDDTLKERLVLSKVRAGILREQSERMRRREKESALEKRKDDDGTDFDPTEKPKKTGGRGGLLTALFAGLIGGIGFIVIKAIPLFKTLFKTLKIIAKPIILLVRGISNLITGIKNKLFPAVGDLEDKERKGKKDIKDLPNRANEVAKNLEFLANAMIFNTVLGMIFTGVGAGKVKSIVNAARSKKLLTGASAVKIQKQLVGRKKVATTTAARELVEARDMVVPRTQFLGGEGFQESVAGRKIIKKISNEVKEESVELVEQGVKTATKGFSATKITDKNINKILENLSSGRPLVTNLQGMKDASKAKTTVRDMTKSVTGDPFAFLAQDEFVRKGRKISKTTSQLSDAGRVMSRMPDTILATLNRKTRAYVSTTNSVKRERLYNEIADILRKSGADQKGINNYFDKVIQVNRPKITSKSFQQLDLLQDNKRLFQGVGPFTAPVIPKTAVTSAKTATRTAVKGFTKQTLRQTLGAVPLLGDLAVLLLDIYVFKEIPARAGYKTIGSIIGSVLGGLLGGLIAAGTAGSGVFLIPALTILGGIGGDILGGMLYDMLDKGYDDYGPFTKPTKFKSTSASDIGRAGLSGGVKGSTIGKTVKDAAGRIGKGVFENKGGPEFMFDNDTYMAFNKEFPGLFESVNLAEGEDSINILRKRLSYEKKGGRTKMIPIPIPMVAKNTTQDDGSIIINKKEGASFLAMNTQTLYRRS